MTCRLAHGEWCAASPHSSECRCVSLFCWPQLSVTISCPWYLSIRGQWPSERKDPVGTALHYYLPGTGMKCRDCFFQQARPAWVSAQRVSMSTVSLSCCSPDLGARAPAPDAGVTTTGASPVTQRTLNRAWGTAAASTILLPSLAPGHRRSSWDTLSSHPHLCPRRTGAPCPGFAPQSDPHCPSSSSSVMPLLGVSPGLTQKFPPWWRLWRVSTLGTEQPGQPCHRHQMPVTGSEKPILCGNSESFKRHCL